MMRYLGIAAVCTMWLVACSDRGNVSESHPTPVNRWSTDEAWSVLQATEKRDIPALNELLQNPIWQIRRSAALGLASVRRSEAVPSLLAALRDSSAAVRAAGAFALGLNGTADNAEDMLDMLRYEHEATVRYALYEAIGRTGDSLTLNRLIHMPQKMGFDSLGLAWGLYGMANRGISNPSLVDKCLELLLHPDNVVRLGSAHALAKTPPELLSTKKKELTKWLRMEPTPEVRMPLIRAFGRIADRSDLPELVTAYERGTSLEKVNILRVLRTWNDRMSHSFLVAALADSSYQVSQTAANTLISRPDFDVSGVYEYDAATEFEEVRLTLLGAQLRKSPSKGRISSIIQSEFGRSSNPYIRAAAIAISVESTGSDPKAEWVAMAMADSSTSIERTAATKALFNWLDRQDGIGQEELISLSELLNSTDPGVLADVASYITSRESFKGNDVAQLKVFAEHSIASLQLPRDLEAKLLLENAIAHLDGKELPDGREQPFNHPIDRVALNNLRNGQEYIMSTDRGEARFRTFVDEAPGSCLAFDSLVQSGYYDGKYFHRIVPNFVAQAGCPRGDGYGSMDWTLRTEIGLSRYETGSIGLASAGPDTESCQFFITHSPTPHLDGNYTRFGQVFAGMNVVNNFVVGDMIHSIRRVQHSTDNEDM